MSQRFRNGCAEQWEAGAICCEVYRRNVLAQPDTGDVPNRDTMCRPGTCCHVAREQKVGVWKKKKKEEKEIKEQERIEHSQ